MSVVHGIVLVDKPSGPTSHDVVAKARRALGTRQIGHAGTLDPMATGLLVLGVGEGRKVLRYLTLDDKRYQARISLGVQTDTLDAEGKPQERAAVPANLDVERVREACRAFVGVIKQRPPAVSALKQGGVALHERVRRGEVVEPAEREVVVHSIEVEELEGAEIALSVHCGKGFYVRSLARDLALALGTRGHLSALRRTASGHFQVSGALSLPRLVASAPVEDPTVLGSGFLSIAEAVAPAPRVTLDAEGVTHASHGRRIPRAHACLVDSGLSADESSIASGTEPVVLCDTDGKALALGRAEEDGFVVVRGLRYS